MKFFLQFEPSPPTTTAQMHRVVVRDGRPVFFDSPALADARVSIMARLAKFAPAEPLGGPLMLVCNWSFPVSKGGKPGWRTAKPDTDNLQKLLKDCLTRSGFWNDDAQVVSELCTKRNEPVLHGIMVVIEEMEEA